MRVLTWNVQGRIGEWRQRHQAISSILAAAQPDVVTLQESWVEPDGSSQAEQLADSLGLHVVTAAELAGFDRYPQATYWVVNAILSRWPSRIVRAVSLHDEDDQPTWRHLLLARVERPEAEGGPFLTGGTHLEHGIDRSATRCAQMAHLLSEVANELGTSDQWRLDLPAIVAGDFNAVPWSDEVRKATGASLPFPPGLVLVDAWEACGNTSRGDTWSSMNPLVPRRAVYPNRRLDYITTTAPRRKNRGAFSSCELLGIDPIGGVQPSDHYAVLAEVEL